MKPSFWITLVITASLGIVALVAQAASNKRLAQRLADEQSKAVPVEDRERVVEVGPKQPRSPEDIDRALAEIEAMKPKASKEQAEGMLAQAEALLAALGASTAHREVFMEFLRSVDGFGADELVALAAKAPDATFKKWLLLLAAEQDPERLVQGGEWKGSISPGEMAMALAERDPAAALAMLPPMKPLGPDDDTLFLSNDSGFTTRIKVATKALGSDLEVGLQAILAIQENLAGANETEIPLGDFGALGTPDLPEESVPGVIAAMGDPQYAEIRDDLLRMTVTHLLFNGGPTAVIERVDSMQLTPEEVTIAIERMDNLDAMTSEPKPLMDWLSEVRPNRIPGAVVDWAERDLEGATAWLGAQDPSPTRDQALARFVREATKLDPTSAELWAREIQDQTLRDQTLRSIPGN